MKKNVTRIIACATALLLFPFLGLSESWEYAFVIILAFAIGYSALQVLRNINGFTKESGADSLQEYIEGLKKRFKDEKKKHQKVAETEDTEE